MDVILLSKVENLGNLGDMVAVSGGYGRNFLIPTGKAVPATSSNREAFEARRAELERVAAEELAVAQKRCDAINEQTFTIVHRAGEENKLFGSVGTVDIAEIISAGGTEITKKEVRLPEGAIRTLGQFDIEIHFHPEVNASVVINVEPEE